MQWQDISTAPRDGSKIDLWVVWSDGSANRYPDSFWNDEAGTWQIGQYSLDQYTDKDARATHWLRVDPPA